MVTKPIFKTITSGNHHWLSLAEVPPGFSMDDLYKNFPSQPTKNLLIRGCNQRVVRLLKKFGFQSFYIGQEAVLHLSQNPFEKKSLAALVRRGLRHGRVIEIPFSLKNKHRIEQLKSESPYGNHPQLENLYRTELEPEMRGFVFMNAQQEWLAAITISQVHSQKMHTELLVKKEKTPVGIMEALVHHIHKTLRKGLVTDWSLGEVPFVDDGNKKSVMEYMAGVLRRSLRMVYNYQGIVRIQE